MPDPFAFEPDLLDRPCLTALPGVSLVRLEPAHAGAIAEGLNDVEVAKNLVAVPNPYAVADAQAFLAGPAASPRMLCAGLVVDAAFAGCVAVDATAGAPELGYWLAKPLWGRGIMRAATRAMVDLVFTATAVEAIVSGHFVGNEASAANLDRLGFRRTGVVETRSRARSAPVRLVQMKLDRGGWAATQPEIATHRLVMRPPTLADADEIARLADDREVALMTASISQPYRREDARAFVLSAARRGRPRNASFAMRLKATGALAGGVGWNTVGPAEIELGYWLGAEHRGVGLATEAARAVLDVAFEATGATAARASCRVINPSSRGVLERCGFQREGSGLLRSGVGGGPVAVDHFTLDREVFASLKAWGAPPVEVA